LEVSLFENQWNQCQSHKDEKGKILE